MTTVRKSLIATALIALAACATEPKSPGVLWLSYSTKIGDELPFNWRLSFDGRAPVTVSSATTATMKFDSLSAGPHQIVVSDMPLQCTTGNDNRTVDVGGGDTVRLSIQVVCARVTGDVAVTVSTTGPDRDLDGYILLVDGEPAVAIPPATAVTRIIGKLKPGTHLFALNGVASNCSVSNGAASAFVTAGNSVLTSLSVNCVAVSGNLRVITTTSGGALADPSGYIVRVGTTTTASVAANATTPVSVPAGSYTVTLSDIEPNCSAAVAQKNVTIAVGVTTDVTFDITCGAYAPTTASVAATDPVVDTLPNQLNNPAKAFDIVGVTTRYASNYVALTLRFSRAIGTDGVIGYIDFDLDENSATGVPPLMNTYGGAAPQGVEARLSFSTSGTLFGVVSTIQNGFGLVRTTVDADSIRFIIPFERLDGDDGNMTVTAIIGTPDRPTDLAPNSGVLVSHLPASPLVVSRRPTAPRLSMPSVVRLSLPPSVWGPPR